MKIFKKLIQALFAALLLILISVSCEETGSLTTDPVDYGTPFTFTPSHGYPGTTIQLSGDLSGVTNVTFGNIAGDFTASGSNINVVVPVGAVTSRIKVVKNGVVISSATNFVVDDTPIPTVIEFSPAVAGSGDVITISGNLLDQVDSVFIGGLKAVITGTPTASELQIIAPSGLQSSRIRLFYTYLTHYGMYKPAESASESELILGLPIIISISPDITALDIGDEVTITGTMMTEVTKVEFGTIEATFEAESNELLKCTVPVGAITGTIKLTHPDGVAEAGSFKVNLPAITSFMPNSKGSPLPSTTPRAFVIDGTMFDLVDSVLIGTTKADVTVKTDKQLLVTVAGNTTGFASLYTKNGIIKSTLPFFFPGEFWVNDWETVFTENRYANLANNNFTGITFDETGDFARITTEGGINDKSFYLWGPGATDDKFFLYESNPQGVYLEFDLNIIDVAESEKFSDGTLKFKIYTMDSKGWGASGAYSYGANGPTSYVTADGNWHHFRFHLADFVSSDNSGLYTADQVNGIAGAYCHPNSLRILAFVFGTANASGNGGMVLGLDNVKFVIE